MKTIAISIPLGYYARNLLRTGMPERLLASDPELQVLLTTPAYQEPPFIEEFSNHGRVRMHPLYEVKTTHNFWERILWKSCILSMKHRPLFLPLMRFNHFCYRLFGSKKYDFLFETWKPKLLITASPGFHSQKDIPLIREAQDHGVKTLCAVFSWDNLTITNGIFPTRPDYLAVWNPMMKEEAVRIHHYDPERVFVVGPTAFDIYQDPTITLSREVFCKKLGLDPQKKIVTLATASPVVFDHRYLVEMLLRFVRDGVFDFPVNLLCRVHPRDQQDLYREFEKDPHIHFDYPGRLSTSLRWDPDRSEMIHLANTLKHSDVIINIASTITIESAIVDTPVISIGFCTVQKEDFEKKIIRNHYGQHYRYILESGGTWNVRSEEEFIEAINTYLKDPSRDHEARRKMAEKLCYRLDGKATERLAELIERLVNEEN